MIVGSVHEFFWMIGIVLIIPFLLWLEQNRRK